MLSTECAIAPRQTVHEWAAQIAVPSFDIVAATIEGIVDALSGMKPPGRGARGAADTFAPRGPAVTSARAPSYAPTS